VRRERTKESMAKVVPCSGQEAEGRGGEEERQSVHHQRMAVPWNGKGERSGRARRKKKFWDEEKEGGRRKGERSSSSSSSSRGAGRKGGEGAEGWHKGVEEKAEESTGEAEEPGGSV